MKRPMIFASDFDNTLHFNDGYREEDLQAIEDFQKRGNLFGLCSGRSLFGMKRILPDHLSPDFYIVATGSLIVDKSGNTIFSKIIDRSLVEKLYLDLSKHYMVNFNTGKEFLTFRYLNGESVVIHSFAEVKEEIHGISFLAEDVKSAKQCQVYLQSHYPVSVFQNGPFVDITAFGCSKGEAIRILRKKYPDSLFAGMGDSYNDIPLLEQVDCSFTFFSAPREVKEKAKQVTSSLASSLNLLLKEEKALAS